MKTKALLLALLMAGLIALTMPITAMANYFPSSIKWRKGQPRVSLETTRGKMVVVVFFQSWCGKCNQWSPTLIKQMQERYGEDLDVVLVALKTDSSSIGDAEGYLERSGADLDRWIVGVDPQGAYMQSFNFGSSLWMAAIYSPQGKLTKKNAGMFYTGQKDKQFVLADPRLKSEHGANATKLIPADVAYDAKLFPIVRAIEFGDITLGLSALKRAPGSLKEDAKKIEQAMMDAFASRLPALKASVEDANAQDRYPAYKQLQLMAKQLRRTEVGDQANVIVQAHRRDEGIKKEEKAERAFKSLMAKAGKLKPNDLKAQLNPALEQFAKAKAYAGTCYARQAQAMADGM